MAKPKNTPENTPKPEVTTPEVATPEVTTPEVATPEVTTPEVATPKPEAEAKPEAVKPSFLDMLREAAAQGDEAAKAALATYEAHEAQALATQATEALCAGVAEAISKARAGGVNEARIVEALRVGGVNVKPAMLGGAATRAASSLNVCTGLTGGKHFTEVYGLRFGGLWLDDKGFEVAEVCHLAARNVQSGATQCLKRQAATHIEAATQAHTQAAEAYRVANEVCHLAAEAGTPEAYEAAKAALDVQNEVYTQAANTLRWWVGFAATSTVAEATAYMYVTAHTNTSIYVLSAATKAALAGFGFVLTVVQSFNKATALQG